MLLDEVRMFAVPGTVVSPLLNQLRTTCYSRCIAVGVNPCRYFFVSQIWGNSGARPLPPTSSTIEQ